MVPAAAFGRGPGAGEEGARHAANPCADLPAGLDRRRLHDPARDARGASATRIAEAGDDPCRARHPLDGSDVRRCPHSRTGRRSLGSEGRAAEEEPRGEQQILRGGAEIRAALLAAVGGVILSRIRGGDRRRAGRHGGGEPRRRRCRRALDRPQHRAAARTGAQRLCDAGAVFQFPLFRRSARCIS